MAYHHDEKSQESHALQAALGQLYRGRPSHPTPAPWLDRGTALSPPFPPYKYQRRERSEGGRKKRRGEIIEKRTNKNRKKEREKRQKKEQKKKQKEGEEITEK
jgi:hypothetical protein